ncbi:MAG: thioester domain-containing protein [Oscillospiraceae bacterium]|nr:thioester domain-containing protein [Oscillospiraceae bacterium]
MKRRYLRASVAILLAALFAFSAMAAAQVGSTAVFRRRFHAPFASLSAFNTRDPFTGQTLHNPRGLHFLFVDSPGTLQAFCVQKGMTIYDTGQITRVARALNDPMFNGLSAVARENMLRVALFGYPNRTPAQLGTTAQNAQAATQILLWESQLGFRNAQFNRTDNRLHNAYFAGGNIAAVHAVVERIERDIAQYLHRPVLPAQLQFHQHDGHYIALFNEPSGVPLVIAGANPDGIAVTREGDRVMLYTTRRPMHGGTITLMRTDIPAARVNALGPPLIWIDPARQFHNQLLFTGVQPRGQSFVVHICMPAPVTTTQPTTTTTTTTQPVSSSQPTTTTQPISSTQPSTATTTTQPSTTTIASTQTSTTTRHTSTTAVHTTTTTTTRTTTTQQTSTTRPGESFPQTRDNLPVAGLALFGVAVLGAWLLRKKDDDPDQ